MGDWVKDEVNEEMGPEDTDWLEGSDLTRTGTGTVLSSFMDQIKLEVEELTKKKLSIQELEQQLKEAQNEYAQAQYSLAHKLVDEGVSELKLEDGRTVCIENKCYCSPNKNSEDRQEQIDWLCKYGGEHLVKESATLDSSEINIAVENGLHPKVVKEFNTNSLKSFIKDVLGLTGGVAQCTLDAIPSSFHFLLQQELAFKHSN